MEGVCIDLLREEVNWESSRKDKREGVEEEDGEEKEVEMKGMSATLLSSLLSFFDSDASLFFFLVSVGRVKSDPTVETVLSYSSKKERKKRLFVVLFVRRSLYLAR